MKGSRYNLAVRTIKGSGGRWYWRFVDEGGSPHAGTLTRHDAPPTEEQANAEAWLVAESVADMVAVVRPGYVRTLLPPVDTGPSVAVRAFVLVAVAFAGAVIGSAATMIYLNGGWPW